MDGAFQVLVLIHADKEALAPPATSSATNSLEHVMAWWEAILPMITGSGSVVWLLKSRAAKTLYKVFCAEVWDWRLRAKGVSASERRKLITEVARKDLLRYDTPKRGN